MEVLLMIQHHVMISCDCEGGGAPDGEGLREDKGSHGTPGEG